MQRRVALLRRTRPEARGVPRHRRRRQNAMRARRLRSSTLDSDEAAIPSPSVPPRRPLRGRAANAISNFSVQVATRAGVRRVAYFFAPGEPACGPCLAKPLGAEEPAAADFALSFLGFLASLLLRNCPLAITRLPRSPHWRFAVDHRSQSVYNAFTTWAPSTDEPAFPTILTRRSRPSYVLGRHRVVVAAPLSRHFIV